jgi:plasmid stabilization system protein ParE
MEQRNIQVIWQKRAENALSRIHQYIAKNNPQNALHFIDRMVDFGENLGDFPDKFPISRFPKFAHHQYHSAVFENHFIFFYRVKGKKLYICNVIRTSRLK